MSGTGGYWTNDELGLPDNATQVMRDKAITDEYDRLFPKDNSRGLRTDFRDCAVRQRVLRATDGLPRKLRGER